MFSIIRIIILMLFAVSVVMGGMGISKGESSFLTSGIGLLLAAIFLIFIYKIIWKAIGCLVVVGILILGSFMIFSGTGKNVPSFGGISNIMSSMSSDKKISAEKVREKKNILISPNVNIQEKVNKKREMPSSSQQQQTPQQVKNTISGTAKVINGDTIKIGRRIVRLFGIDAPEANQTCADKSGNSYRCGQRAALELKRMLGNSEVVCSIMQQNSKGHAIGTCVVGVYDIGAAMIVSGWALAYREFSGNVYVPYENKAREKQIGLWEGEFYTPWDWREHNNMQKKNVMPSMLDAKNKTSSGLSTLSNAFKIF